jgi:2-dehydropantoate 2-reductase
MNKRIAVLGTGANGGAIAASMTRAGFDVTCIEQWPEHVDVIRHDGLTVNSPSGQTVTKLAAVNLCDVATLRKPFDIVFVVVKGYDTRWACELILPLLTPDSLVVGVQNGMTIDDMVAILGPNRTVGCVIEVAANMFEPGLITQQTGMWFAIGSEDASVQRRLSDVAEVLCAAGEVEIVDDIRSSKWMKLVANAAELVTSAILDLPLLEAIALPGMHEFMTETGKEAGRTAVALGHKIVPIFGMADIDTSSPDAFATELLDRVLTDYSLPDTRTTVLQDWMKRRRAEIEEINGLVVREQARLGGHVPANEITLRLAREIEAGTLEAGPHLADRLSAALK